MVDQNPTVDQVESESSGTGTPLQENIKSRSTWLRLLFMLIYSALIGFAGLVGTFVVVVGFFWVLFTGEVNQQLQQVGQAIARYIYEIVRYLTFNTDDKPFPFGGEWPSEKADEQPD
jgi:hypothetical protein